MNGYVKYFNDNKCMNLLVHDKELLKKYDKIRDKIKGFDKIRKDDEYFTCLSGISLDAVVTIENDYPNIFRRM